MVRAAFKILKYYLIIQNGIILKKCIRYKYVLIYMNLKRNKTFCEIDEINNLLPIVVGFAIDMASKSCRILKMFAWCKGPWMCLDFILLTRRVYY